MTNTEQLELVLSLFIFCFDYESYADNFIQQHKISNYKQLA